MALYYKKTIMKKSIYALATLSGTIIGAGIFSLPYIASKVGIEIMLAYFLVLGPVAIIVHLFLGELSLKTPDFLRLPGFVGFYLGDKAKTVALISSILGIFGALLAYLIIGGQFLAALSNCSVLLCTFVYFIGGVFFIYFGIKTISKIELAGLILFFFILIGILFRGWTSFKLDNLFPMSDPNYFFLPYGAILFSIWGASLVPEIEEMLGGKKHLLKKIIPIAILIPILISFLFIILVLGITGSQTTETAIDGLYSVLGNGIISLGLLFCLFATFTSFITLGLTLKKIFWYDLKIEKNKACLITCFVPIFLFLIGLQNFIQVIGLAGGILLSIDGILIILMYRKLNKKQFRFLTIPLILLFVLGIICEIIYFI